jgi:hypothetical protein
MNTVSLDKDNRIIGWCDEKMAAEFSGAVKTITQDMTGFSLDASKVSGGKIVSKTEKEITDSKFAIEAETVKEKAIALQMRLDAMTKLGLDTTVETAAMSALSLKIR